MEDEERWSSTVRHKRRPSHPSLSSPLTSRKKLHDEVQIDDILKGVVHFHNPRIVCLHQNVPFSSCMCNLGNVKVGKTFSVPSPLFFFLSLPFLSSTLFPPFLYLSLLPAPPPFLPLSPLPLSSPSLPSFPTCSFSNMSDLRSIFMAYTCPVSNFCTRATSPKAPLPMILRQLKSFFPSRERRSRRN